jgi:hypothetical protein
MDNLIDLIQHQDVYRITNANMKMDYLLKYQLSGLIIWNFNDFNSKK